jgi:hypothetical protein
MQAAFAEDDGKESDIGRPICLDQAAASRALAAPY